MGSYKFYFFIFFAYILILSSCVRDFGSLVNVAPQNRASAIASWQASLPIEFSSNQSFGSSEPNVQINSAGQIVIIWTQSDGANYQIFYSYFDGVSWDHPTILSDNISPDGQEADSPQVAMNSDGNIVITWTQSDGANSQIFYSHFDGVSWDHPTSLSDNISPDGQEADSPQVAMNSDGKIVITWTQSDGANVSWA